MTHFLEKTDYIERFLVPSNPLFTISHEDVNQTYGGELLSHFTPLSAEDNLIDHALESLRQNETTVLAVRARRVLLAIQDKINYLLKNKLDLPPLPKIHAFNVDDGSILLEWVFDDFRIGFSIEPLETESSWFLITNEERDSISASGYLSDTIENTLLWIISFVIVNT